MEKSRSERLARIVEFKQAMDNAFEEKGIEFGTIEFTCPVCQGKAHAQKISMPYHSIHKVAFSAVCEHCDISMMN